MRLWSVHPRLLDHKGLVACWREGLLAQKVLLGQTRGYRNHPQLERFRATEDPILSIGVFLRHLAEEATRRGYSFNFELIVAPGGDAAEDPQLSVTTGQLAVEFRILGEKVRNRDPEWWTTVLEPHAGESDPSGETSVAWYPQPHPVLRPVEGPRESWERYRP